MTFNGNCEEAFEFYKAVFKGDFTTVSKFKDMPPNPEYPMSDEEKEKIMHISLPIGDTVLMGSDTGGEWASNYKPGNNFSISIGVDSKEKADSLFAELSEGGSAIMPMENTFWDSYFGMFTDRFGIQWMVSYDAPNRNK